MSVEIKKLNLSRAIKNGAEMWKRLESERNRFSSWFDWANKQITPNKLRFYMFLGGFVLYKNATKLNHLLNHGKTYVESFIIYDDGTPIGMCGLDWINTKDKTAELWGLTFSGHGGKVDSAISLIQDYAAFNLGLTSLHANVMPNNEKSIKCMNRNGYTNTGLHRCLATRWPEETYTPQNVFTKTLPSKIDIPVACSYCLEGALTRYRDILPKFSDADFQLIHEWNLQLKQTLKQPEFKKYTGPLTRIVLNFSPVKVSKFLDTVAVKYRSYYYAKRFLDALNFTTDKLDADDTGIFVDVVDFGRGVSPWEHVLRQHNKTVQIHAFENNPVANHVFQTVSDKMGLPTAVLNKESDDEAEGVFVSLGTFVYLSKQEQYDLLQKAIKKYKNAFVELEKTAATQSDAKLVQKHGAKYQKGLSNAEIAQIMGDTPYKLREISDNPNIVQQLQLQKATEHFLVTR